MSALPFRDRSTAPSRILHVDDDSEFGEITALLLQRESERFEIETVTNAADGLDRLAAAEFDCVVSDYDMPGRNGIEFLETVRETHPDLPFILFTGKGSEEVASDAITAGVTDYLQKKGSSNQYTVLANRITNAIEHYHSRQLVERSERQLREIIDSISHFLYVIDEDGEYVLANEALAAFYGVTVEEVEGANVADMLDETAAAQFYENLQATFEADTRRRFAEVPVRNSEGETRIFDLRLLPYELDGTEKRAVLGIADDVTGRVERERELERHEAYLKESTDIIAVLDANGTVNYQSPSVTRVLGYGTTELLGQDGFQFVHPDDLDAVLSAFASVVTESGGSVTVECRFRTADDDWRWLEIHGRNQLEHPVIEGVVTNNRDITERKLREQELERASDLLAKTERIADVGGWEIDTETTAVFWTENLYELLGLEYDEPLQLEDALEIYHEADRPVVQNAVETALETGESFDVEVRFRGPDDEVRWLRVQGIPTVEDGTVVTLRGAVQDVTDRRKREQTLTQAQTEYEELLNGMNDTAWVLDTDGNFLVVNDAAVESIGYSRAELLTMSVYDIDADHDTDWITTHLQEMPDHEVEVFETVHRTRDGTLTPVEISSSVVSYRGETVILSIGRNISSRKEHEKQLEAFASVVSHDLRNPLTIARGRLEMAREEHGDEDLAAVDHAHDRMGQLIDDLLTLARDGSQLGALEPVGLADVARSGWRNVATADSALEVTTKQTIQADRSRLQQLLENLMRNAVEHGSTGSQTQSDDSVEHGSTSTRPEADDSSEHGGSNVTVTVGDLEDGFYVEDDGCGIPAANREQLFSFGYSTEEGGTGFGLAIVKQIVDAHGWEIRLSEGATGGARFELTGVTTTD